MKALKYLMVVLFAFTAISCVDDAVTPRGGDEDDDPIIAGGTGGSGQGGGSGSGNGGSNP